MQTLRDRLWAQPPATPPYVLEDVQAARPRVLVHALGTDWLATSRAWVFVGWLIAVGQVLARTLPGRGPRHGTADGAALSALTGVSILTHQLGTIAAARMVGAPMQGVVFTSTLAYNTYPDEPPLPARVHMTRALAGPAGNLAVGLAALTLRRAFPRSRALSYLATVNLVFTAAAMAPLPTMDGGAALRAWRQLRAEGAG